MSEVVDSNPHQGLADAVAALQTVKEQLGVSLADTIQACAAVAIDQLTDPDQHSEQLGSLLSKVSWRRLDSNGDCVSGQECAQCPDVLCKRLPASRRTTVPYALSPPPPL